MCYCLLRLVTVERKEGEEDSASEFASGVNGARGRRHGVTPSLLAGMALSRWVRLVLSGAKRLSSVLDEVWLCFTGQIANDEVTRNRARLMRGGEEDSRIEDSLRTST
jgi:hypothetical protein